MIDQVDAGKSLVGECYNFGCYKKLTHTHDYDCAVKKLEMTKTIEKTFDAKYTGSQKISLQGHYLKSKHVFSDVCIICQKQKKGKEHMQDR